MLSKQEINRYGKQLMLPEIGKAGQEKLKNARVLVVGAGGLGCPVLQYLAATGVGTIGIIDFDLVDETNLQRQLLYTSEDVGKPKVDVVSEKISKLNPFISLQTINQNLETGNALELLSTYDIIVDCTDNVESRYLINDACVLMNKPFVYGGIHKFEGQLAVFNFQGPEKSIGPTYRCVFPENDSEESGLNCNLTGVIGTVPGIIGTLQANEVIKMNCKLTGVIGTLPGIIGTLQANEVIKMITGIGEACSGSLLLMNALTLDFTKIKISRNESLWNGMPQSKEEFMNRNYFLLNESIT